MKREKTTPSREQMLLQLSGLCARGEQCEFDLREKMRKKGVRMADADEIIGWLYDHNFLNESRFARAYARDKHRFNGWGRIKIRMMLRSKRISPDAVSDALESLDEAEYGEVLSRVVASKARSLDLADRADRAKLLRSVYSRGFEPPLIIEAIRRRMKS